MWIVAVLTVMYVINKRMDPAYKLVWTIMILAAPIIGIIFYFVMGKSAVAYSLFQRSHCSFNEVCGKLIELSSRKSYIEVLDIAADTVVGSATFTLPHVVYPNRDCLTVGYADYYRYLNGAYRNFKVWEHI